MDEFEIIMEGTFGWDITLENVVDQLREAAGAPLLVRMSSFGGQVQVAGAIKNALQEYMTKNNVAVTFDMIGWAQSAAGYIMMIPGAKRIAHVNTLWMHHNPTEGIFGDHRELTRRAGILAKMTVVYAESYAEVSGKSILEISAEMEAETFLVGQEIVDAGFADEIAQDSTIPAAACSKDILIRHGKNNIEKITQQLQMAAFGNQPGQSTPPTAPRAQNDNNLEAGMADQNKTEEITQAVAARAKSFAAAMKAMPEKGDALYHAFEDGKGAEYFEGMTAHSVQMKADAEAKAAADQLAAANGAVPVAPGGTPGPVAAGAQTPTAPGTPAAPGAPVAPAAGDNPPSFNGTDGGQGLQPNMQAIGISGGTVEV